MALVRDAMKSAKARGAYYTPANIVSLIVQNTVGRLCDGRTPEQISELKILDPACGDGAFPAAACGYLLERGLTHEQALSCVYGVDVDEAALEAAGRRAGQVVSRASSVVRRQPSVVRGPSCANLRRGDSLLSFDWHDEFPEAMERGGFDAVIGNPPWVSLAGRFGIRAYSKAEIDNLRDRFGGNSYMPNICEYFVLLGLELTRPGGYLSFIVPDRLGFNSQFAGLRRRLLTQAELLLLVYGAPFPGVSADTMIFVIRKVAPRLQSTTEASEYGRPACLYPQAAFLSNRRHEFPRPEDPDVGRLIERMESLPGRLLLKDICDSASGFGGRSSLVHENKIGDSEIPVLKGRSIGRYVMRKRYWFDFRRENLTGRTTDAGKLGASPKILIRKTGDRLIAAYDDSGTYPEQSLYFLYGNRTDLDFRFILGILNSRLMNLYYRTRCLTNKRSFAQVKKADLDRIPLPPIDLSRPADRARHDRLVELVDEMLRQQSPSTDHLIDQLVFGLYGIDPGELRRTEAIAERL